MSKVILENTKTGITTEVEMPTAKAHAYARYVNDGNTGVWAVVEEDKKGEK